MYTRIIASAIAFTIAAPALADNEQYAKVVGVDSDEFTLNEMVQISAADPEERDQRIQVIMKDREGRQKLFDDFLNGSPGVTVTRAAR